MVGLKHRSWVIVSPILDNPAVIHLPVRPTSRKFSLACVHLDAKNYNCDHSLCHFPGLKIKKIVRSRFGD